MRSRGPKSAVEKVIAGCPVVRCGCDPRQGDGDGAEDSVSRKQDTTKEGVGGTAAGVESRRGLVVTFAVKDVRMADSFT